MQPISHTRVFLFLFSSTLMHQICLTPLICSLLWLSLCDFPSFSEWESVHRQDSHSSDIQKIFWQTEWKASWEAPDGSYSCTGTVWNTVVTRGFMLMFLYCIYHMLFVTVCNLLLCKHSSVPVVNSQSIFWGFRARQHWSPGSGSSLLKMLCLCLIEDCKWKNSDININVHNFCFQSLLK